ncbi:hypothetical protein N9Y62_03330 [Luminiphilus sp.]|nr:hypothetical protein [Luminiphilus sp.]
MSLNYNKILYGGGIHREGTSKSRYDALAKKFRTIDLLETESSHKLLSKIKTRLLKNRYNSIDSEFKTQVKSVQYDLVWLDKPTRVSSECMKDVTQSNPRTIFVAHITDDIKTMVKYAPKLEDVLSYFDYVFTPNKFNIEEYPNIPLIYNELGYDAALYEFPTDRCKNPKSTVGFVGHYEFEYANTMLMLADKLLGSDFTLVVNGSGWWKCPKAWMHPKIKISYGWVDLKRLLTIYTQASAAMGLYSIVNRNRTSGRIFEISALGIPIITYGNSTIESAIGKNYIDLNLASNIDNLPSILSDKSYLQSLGINAYKHLVGAKCTWEDRVNEALEHIYFTENVSKSIESSL